MRCSRGESPRECRCSGSSRLTREVHARVVVKGIAPFNRISAHDEIKVVTNAVADGAAAGGVADADSIPRTERTAHTRLITIELFRVAGDRVYDRTQVVTRKNAVHVPGHAATSIGSELRDV